MDTKKFIKEVINAYEMYLEVLKKKKKNKESAKLVGTIFGLKEGIGLSVMALRDRIDKGKDIYINQNDMFECGKIEGFVSVYRILNNDEDAINLSKVLIKYSKI